MNRYIMELPDKLSYIYEDIAKIKKKKVEECIAIILDRVIRTMVNQTGNDNHTQTDTYKTRS